MANDGKATLKAKTLHRVPDEILEVSPEIAAPGTRITITASNLPLYTPVSVSIGNVGVAGHSVGELAESDGNGQWEGTPLGATAHSRYPHGGNEGGLG